MAAKNILGLAHIGLFVKDLEATKRFYTNLLDFDVIHECTAQEADGTTTKIAFIQNADCTIEAVQFANPPQGGDGVVAHIALKVKDIATTRDALAKKGLEFETEEITFHPAFFPNGSKWIFFRGPDHEHIEIAEVL
jgi:lactoylglutathione lyase